jgi:hypothetical protein
VSVLSYQRLKQNPAALRAFTGLDEAAFETLLTSFEIAWHAYIYEHHIRKKRRKRRYGGGRKARLTSLEDKLLEWVHKLSNVLQMALGEAHCLPERHPQNLEQVFSLCVSVDFVIDGTERRTQRPKDHEQQQAQYSGKKTPIPSKTT